MYVAHVAVPAGKLWFLGKSRSNQLCMGEGVRCRFCLAWVNVDFRELVSNGELLGMDDPCQLHGGAFRENSSFGAIVLRKVYRNANLLLESLISVYSVPAYFHPAVSTFGSWLPSRGLRPPECVCSSCGGSSGKTLLSWEIQVKPIVHGLRGGL